MVMFDARVACTALDSRTYPHRAARLLACTVLNDSLRVLLLGVLLLLGCGGEPQTPATPSSQLPVVALSPDAALTLSQAVLSNGELRLSIRITDLELGRSRLGYEQLGARDLSITGVRVEGDMTVLQQYLPVTDTTTSLAQIVGWDLELLIPNVVEFESAIKIVILRLVLIPDTSNPDADVDTELQGPWALTFVSTLVVD